MPYKLEKVQDKYYVVSLTGKRHSKKPMTLKKAEAQKRVLEYAVKDEYNPIYLLTPNKND